MLVSVSEVKCEIRSITNLSTMAALTTVENEIPDFIDIVKKTDYDAKISEMEQKYFFTSNYNKFTDNIPWCKYSRKTLVNESDLNVKVITLATTTTTKTNNISNNSRIKSRAR